MKYFDKKCANSFFRKKRMSDLSDKRCSSDEISQGIRLKQVKGLKKLSKEHLSFLKLSVHKDKNQNMNHSYK